MMMKNCNTTLRFVFACCWLAACSLSAFAQQNRVWNEANRVLPTTVGLWRFDEGKAVESSGAGAHGVQLRGEDTQFSREGKFGGALQIGEARQPGDTRQGAVIGNHPALSPRGAFTMELWFSPDSGFFKKSQSFLIDKKLYFYQSELTQANRDYLILLRKVGEQFVVEAQLGFGRATETVHSGPQTLVVGQWYHLALSYDGNGSAVLSLNGQAIATAKWEGRGAITPGNYPLVIGDRYGSVGARFLGKIDDVHLYGEIAKYVNRQPSLNTSLTRTVFYRGEEQAKLRVKVVNDTAAAIEQARLQLVVPNLFTSQVEVPALDIGKDVTVELPFSTLWRLGQYWAELSLVDSTQKTLAKVENLSLQIVPRPLPEQFPVVMWGALTDENAIQQMKEIGFTHQLVYPINESTVWYGNAQTPPLGDVAAATLRQTLNEMQRQGLGALGMVSPGRYLVNKKFFPRVGRDQKSYPHENTNGLYEKAQQFAYDVGTSVATHYRDEPVLEGALIHTEVRDDSRPSFDAVDRAAYLKFSSKEIPAEVNDARGVAYQNLKNFPSNRVVADDYPLLQYYRWFWKQGDGWNTLNSRANDGLKSVPDKKLWTWFDPAGRAPSIYGSGGNVDYLNQWTYTYPDPLKIDLAMDELLAMSGGQENQRVMNMTQIIWYRTQTTASPIAGTEKPWEKAVKDAPFITIAPDHLSEALWLKLSRPVQGIMYHGWGSLGGELGFSQGAYHTTNTQTRARLQQLLHEVVQPLGPTLKQLSDVPSDVAFLQSFTSQMLAGRGTYGWGNGWGADSYLIARYAGLTPEIIYEETILKEGLKRYKILFLTHCDVLTQSVVAAVQQFQAQGGIVIADDHLVPEIQPDILLPELKRGPAQQAKKLLLEEAAGLNRELEGLYRPLIDSDNPEVLVRRRRYRNSDYIFTINDHRTYGDYVGQYQKVMEKGLPSTTTVSLNRVAGIVYDLTRQRKVETKTANQRLQFEVALEGGGGNLFLVMDEAVGPLQLAHPQSVRRKGQLTLNITLNHASGKPLQAAAPLRVTIRDSQNREVQGSGYYSLLDGKLAINVDIAANDITGQWQIEVEEKISGQKKITQFEVQ